MSARSGLGRRFNMAPHRAKQGALWLAASLACACIHTPDFPDPQRIDRPRILAVVAQPPEAMPGEDVQLSVMVGGGRVERVSWRLCAGFYSFVGNQYDEGLDDDSCAGSFSLPLPESGIEATVPGLATQTLFESNREELEGLIFGLALPEGTLDAILHGVGVPILARVTVQTNQGQLTAIKRILFSLNAPGNSNPPPPRLNFGNALLVYNGGFECVPSDGQPLTLRAGQPVEVVPIFDGESEPWIETYAVLDARGQVVPRLERAYYTFYATGGQFDSQTTSSPLRNNVFHAPAAGSHDLWIVIRDGHAGASACHFSLDVI